MPCHLICSGRMPSRHLAAAAAFIAMSLTACGGNSDDSQSAVATWHVGIQDYNELIPLSGVPQTPALTVSNETIRQIAHTSIGGNAFRLHMSNRFGASAVTFGAVHVAKSAGGGATTAGTDQTVTFNGQPSVTIAAGADAWSDSVAMALPTQSDLAVSVFVADSTPVATSHVHGGQINYSVAGNHVADTSLAGASGFESYYWLSDVDVVPSRATKVLVAFGDSITGGYQSTIDANRRWPNILDNRAQAADSPTGPISVVNSGIGGNRLLYDYTGPRGLDRFDRDVIGVSGVTHVVLALGINDIAAAYAYGALLVTPQPATSDQLIAGIQTLVQRAKAKGLKVYLATLTPMQGSVAYTDAGEAVRESVNAYIRSASGIDGVIDFDQALKDPAHPLALTPAYDSGDHLHPSDAGYLAMGNLVDLNTLK